MSSNGSTDGSTSRSAVVPNTFYAVDPLFQLHRKAQLSDSGAKRDTADRQRMTCSHGDDLRVPRGRFYPVAHRVRLARHEGVPALPRRELVIGGRKPQVCSAVRPILAGRSIRGSIPRRRGNPVVSRAWAHDDRSRGAMRSVGRIGGFRQPLGPGDPPPAAAGPARCRNRRGSCRTSGGRLQGCPLRGVRPRRWRCGCRARTALRSRRRGFYARRRDPPRGWSTGPSSPTRRGPMRPLVVDHMPSVLRGGVRAPPRAPRAGQGVRPPAAGADAVRGPRSAASEARPGPSSAPRPPRARRMSGGGAAPARAGGTASSGARPTARGGSGFGSAAGRG